MRWRAWAGKNRPNTFCAHSKRTAGQASRSRSGTTGRNPSRPGIRSGFSTCGAGRNRPISPWPLETLKAWAAQFADQKVADYVFPSEKIGITGNDEIVSAFDTHAVRLHP